MTKFTFAAFSFSILALTIGCSSASSRSSGNDEGYAGGDAGSSSTAGSGSVATGGAGSGTQTGSTAGGASGAGGSIGSQIDNACLEAGLDDKHPACGTVGNLSCSCPLNLECGGFIWDFASNGTPAWEGSEFEDLINRFLTNTYTNVCGESCVYLSNIEEYKDKSLCEDNRQAAILCGEATTQPSKGINCTLKPGTKGIWCCDSFNGDYASLNTDYENLTYLQ